MFDCVYCQLKRTTKFTSERKEYVKVQAVLSELEQFFKNYKDSQKIDYVTISGSGEPLLNSSIKNIILGIRQLTKTPVALITNSVLLSDPKVRSDILEPDLILPSLDAVTQDVFEKIDRPFSSNIKVYDIINGLIALRKEFKGKIWLEIMLVKGINDDLEYIQNFKTIIGKIKPDKVQINIPSRPPSEDWVKHPLPRRLRKIKEILGINCELI